MAQQNLITRQAVTYWGPEATFGLGGGALSQIWPKSDSFDDNRMQDEVPVDDESTYFFDEKPSLLGNKNGGLKLALNVQSGAILNAAASPATTPNNIGLKTLLGGETAQPGSLVATGTSSTIVVVTATQGARFAAGQVVLVEFSGTLYPTVIASVATDTLTFALALPGTPGVGALVINAYNYYLTDANVSTLEVRRAIVGDVNEQYQYLGATGSFDLGYDRGKLLTIAYDLKAADWAEGALGYATTYTGNTQRSEFVLTGATTLLQPVATTTRVQLPFHSISFKFNVAMDYVPEHGGINGNTQAMRVGSDRIACEITLKTRRDRQLITWWNSRTQLRLLHATPFGSGLSKQYAGVHVPLCMLRGAPKPINEGGRALHQATLIAMMDGTQATALLRAPYSIFNG